jgi:hypothetical protein
LKGTFGDIRADTEVLPFNRDSKHNYYQQLWQRYSDGVEGAHPRQIDCLVGRRAFEAGLGKKDIALMLVAGSPVVRQIEHSQSKDKARCYVNWVAGLICGPHHNQSNNHKRQLELGD